MDSRMWQRQPYAVLLLLQLILLGFATLSSATPTIAELPAGKATLLTDPYLQNPQKNGVYVVWLSNFKGIQHKVIIGPHSVATPSTSAHNESKVFYANTTKIERMFEDAKSDIGLPPTQVMQRVVYRHEAFITHLQSGVKRSYRVLSITDDGDELTSASFTLQALPADHKPLKILLTSDFQQRYNALSNYQKVSTVFPALDAIFFAGDLVNHPRRGSEWLDSFNPSWLNDPAKAKPAFFQAMQGRFDKTVPTTVYRGGQLLQNMPIFPAIANHEISGRFRPNQPVEVNGLSSTIDINAMFNDPQPKWFAEYQFEQNTATAKRELSTDGKIQWIRDHSHDFETYRDIFTLPNEGPEGESYYSKKFGDVLLISMNVSRIWRTWNIDVKGKFSEAPYDLNTPQEWGFGEHLFTPFGKGSKQYRWLQEVLKSEEFKTSQYQVLMFHQSAFGLGDNVVPALSNPVLYLDAIDSAGQTQTHKVAIPADDAAAVALWAEKVVPLIGRIKAVRYEYPIDKDYFRYDIEPLLHAAGVDLVLTGHSHIWNRSKTGNLHFLETSNVGNCFGAYWAQPNGLTWNNATRASANKSFWTAVKEGRYDEQNYPRVGDVFAREPIMPTLMNPMQYFGLNEQALPFVCSNSLSVFSVLDTEMGAVRSFVYEVNEPDSKPIEFDRLLLNNDTNN